MLLPLDFNNISICIALATIILLITSEILNPRYGHIGFVIERKRLRKAALFLGTILLAIIAFRIYVLMIT